MGWTFRDGYPIYLQIYERIRMDIASGNYASGERIPSVRELALEAGVNPNTMQRALFELERSGYLKSERTTGRYVTDDSSVLEQLRVSLGEDYIGELFTKLEQMGMNREQIVRMVSDWAASHA